MAILDPALKKPCTLHRLMLSYLLSGFVALIASKAIAEETSLQLYEQKIKAGIVYNLLKYTIWPEEAIPNKNGKLQICLYGDDPFDGYLSPLEGRTAQQIPIAITQLNNIKEAEHCNVVIIHRNQAKALTELLPHLDNKNILTVSDIEHFAQQGGMVELAKDGEKISLHINTNVINNTRLNIQGPMLKLAKIVPG
jgi:hypothetical protein